MSTGPRTLALAIVAAAFLPGCASNCDKICGKLELCFLSQGFDRNACLDRCENEPAVITPTGSGGSGGESGAGGTGGESGSGGAGGQAGSGGTGGSTVSAVLETPTVAKCASCYDSADCTGILAGGCRQFCPTNLNP
jgi:hypothetical protein